MLGSALDFLCKFQASFASTEFMERQLASFKNLSVFHHSFIFGQENGACRNILQINMHVESDIKSVYILWLLKKEVPCQVILGRCSRGE